MKTKKDKLQSALKYLREKHNADWCTSYGEPGYQNPEKGIIFANWHNVPKGLVEWLEKCGYAIAWSDEWVIDYDNDKAYRTDPDCYAWECQITYTKDGELLTQDDSSEDWIFEYENDPNKCLPSFISLEGYTLINGNFESGFFQGQTDNPHEIFKVLRDKYESVVFRKSENSQFDIRFEVWVKGEYE